MDVIASVKAWFGQRLARWDGPNRPEDFERFCQTQTLRHLQLGMLVWLFGTLAWWPTDSIVYADDALSRSMLSFTRPTLGAIGMGLWLWLAWLARRPRLANFAVVLAGGINISILGYTVSPIAGLAHAWFYFGYLLPFVSLLVMSPLPKRVLVTIILGVAYPTAYLLHTPTYFDTDDAVPALSFLGFILLCAIALGHAVYLFMRRDYFRQSALEDTVEERTRTLQRLATYLEHSREAERRRVARELHDHHGQLLTGMQLELGAARVLANGHAPLLEALTRVDDLLRQVFATQRNVIAELWPRVLDDRGPAAAVRWCIDELSARVSLSIDAHGLEVLDELSGDQALAVFRATQEALTNIVRHANARTVTIVARRESGAVGLSIADDGRGFDPKSVGPTSFGLLGLRERIAALGGSLRVDSVPGAGTRLTLSISAASGA